MTLNLGPVDIRKTMEAAAEGIRDRLVKDNIGSNPRVARDIGSFSPTNAACGRCSSIFCPTRSASRPAADCALLAERRDRRDRVLGHRPGPGHPAPR